MDERRVGKKNETNKKRTAKQQQKRSKGYIHTDHRPSSASICEKLKKYSVQESMSAAEECQQRWAGVSGTVIEHSSHVVWGSASTMQRNLWQITPRISSWIPSARRSHQKSKKRYSSPPLHPATCAIESFAPRCFMASQLATMPPLILLFLNCCRSVT